MKRGGLAGLILGVAAVSILPEALNPLPEPAALIWLLAAFVLVALALVQHRRRRFDLSPGLLDWVIRQTRRR